MGNCESLDFCVGLTGVLDLRGQCCNLAHLKSVENSNDYSKENFL